jgi:hypothetical protein
MELIIIGTLTTIALMIMQAVEFIRTRRSLADAPLRVPAPADDAAYAADAPTVPVRVNAEDDPVEQAA